MAGLTPPTPDSDGAALLEYAKACYRRSRNHFAKWRDKAKEDYAFVAGDQWTDTERAQLEEKLRIPVKFNRLGTIIDAVCGYEVNNRQEVRYIPRQLGASPVNDLLTGAAKWCRDECDAEDEESDAFADTVICGMGFTETRMTYDEDPDGKVAIDRFDPLEAVPDPTATKRNLDDARFIGRVRKMPRAEVEDIFEGQEITGDGAPWSDILNESSDNPHDATEAKEYKNDQGDNTGDALKDELVVLQLQWIVKEPAWRVLDPSSGQILTMPQDRYTAISKAAKAAGVQLRAAKVVKKKVMQGFFCGDSVTVAPGPDPEHFTLRCITGKRDRNHNTWYGLVRSMKDPQKWANKFFSNIIHLISVGPKGGLLAEGDAFEDQRQAEQSWAAGDEITWAAKGAIAAQKIQPKPPMQFPAGIFNLTEFAVTSIRDTSGVNVETLGLADRDQPGILEAHRKQAAMTILAPMFDALRRYRKEQGRVLLCFIREYLSDGRLIRLEGQDAAQYVQLAKQPDTIEYDVIVDDAPTSPNQKEQVFAVLMQMLPGLMKAGIPLPPDLLDYAPLPSSLAAKWKQYIQQSQQQQPQDPKLIAAQANAQIGQQKAQSDFGLKQAQMQLDMQHQRMAMAADEADDQRRAQLEQQKAQQEIIIEREKAQQQLSIQRDEMHAEIAENQMRANADIAIARARAAADMDLARQKATAQERSAG